MKSLFAVAIAVLAVTHVANADSLDDVSRIHGALLNMEKNQYKHTYGPYHDRNWQSFYSVSKGNGGGVRLGFVRKHEKGKMERQGNALVVTEPLHWLPTGDQPFSHHDKNVVVFDFNARGKLEKVSVTDSYYDEFMAFFIQEHASVVLSAAALMMNYNVTAIRPTLSSCESYLWEVLTGHARPNSDRLISSCSRE